MPAENNDRKQLKGILTEFDLSLAQSVLDELSEDKMPRSVNFTNQGKKCEPGQDGFIDRQTFESDLEAVWGQDNLLSAHFLTEGAEIQKAVAMVTLKTWHNGLPAGNGWGSGFLISNSLFLTNNHVIPNASFCDKVNMQFMYQDNYNSQPPIFSEFFETDENSFFHTNAALDYTIVRLKPNPIRFVTFVNDIQAGKIPHFNSETRAETAREFSIAQDFIAQKASISDYDLANVLRFFGYAAGTKYGFIQLRASVVYPEGLRLNIIQHPQGRKKEVVVQQNELRDAHANVIHYYSDTDYGSSGSPVLNNTWGLMALHHARNTAESSNEGIRIDKIVADLRSIFQTSNPDVLTELGI